ncbi:MAG TPA: amino acid racemase [Pyrinomonadaceae bacterium]
MKTAGIIGGLGPESTIEYYHQIIALFLAQSPERNYPSFIINSINLKKVIDLITASKFADLTNYLLAEINRLANAGANFAAVSANTPHVVFDELRSRSPIPLISIVEATCKRAQEMGLKRVGLFGTRFTMQGQFYPKVFGQAKIELAVPTLDEQNYIHRKYMDELVNGIFLSDTHDEFLRIAECMRSEERIEGLILGGTELPLLLKQAPNHDLPFLDTTKIHVESIVQEMLSDLPSSTDLRAPRATG